MFIYRLARLNDIGYDEFDAFVVAASSEEDARKIACKGDYGDWHGNWMKAEIVSCELIGHACVGIDAGVVLGSFCAG